MNDWLHDVEGRKDLYPENLIGRGNYHDTGCTLAPRCLECPFDECMEGNEPGVARSKRNAEIRKLARAGKKVAYIAQHAGVSKRTVHRVMGGTS